jgi:hypothetical protein
MTLVTPRNGLDGFGPGPCERWHWRRLVAVNRITILAMTMMIITDDDIITITTHFQSKD